MIEVMKKICLILMLFVFLISSLINAKETKNKNIFCEWTDNYTNTLYVFVINKNVYQDCKSRNNKSKESTKERYCKTWKNSVKGRTICEEKIEETFTSFNSEEIQEQLTYWKELYEENLITVNDYYNKKISILYVNANFNVDNNDELKNHLVFLKNFFQMLFDKELITKEELDHKIKTILDNIQINFSVKNKEELKTQLQFWKSLLLEGIITEELYALRKDSLLNTKFEKEILNTKLEKEIVIKVDKITQEKLDKLSSYLKRDLITKEEFEEKKKELLDSVRDSTKLSNYACFKNWEGPTNVSQDGMVCFCLRPDSTVYYNLVHKSPSSILKVCGERKTINYGDYLAFGGRPVDNENSKPIGGQFNHITEVDIANWKNELKIKADAELKRKKKIKSNRSSCSWGQVWDRATNRCVNSRTYNNRRLLRRGEKRCGYVSGDKWACTY